MPSPLDRLGKEVLVFDGAMGTLLQAQGLPPGQPPDTWCLEHPDAVERAHRQYVDAGADVVETNTFGATPIRLSRHGLEHLAHDINVAAVRIARKATEGRAYVAASMGPLGVLVEPLGEFPFESAYEQYAAQARTFAESRPDFIIIETIGDLNEMRAAILACKDNVPGIPIIAQMTVDAGGRTFTGTDPETAGLVLQSMGADVVGFNCSVGPDLLLPAVERLCRAVSIPVSVQPNAGLPILGPDGKTSFPVNPAEFASYGPKLVEAGACIVGGCCGTTPDHIRLLKTAVSGLRSRRPGGPLSQVTGLASRTQALFFTRENLPVRVGVRLELHDNAPLLEDVSRMSFSLIRKEARNQVSGGAQALSVSIGDPAVDGAGRMSGLVAAVQKAVRVPVCILSSSQEALDAGLKAFVGKALIGPFTASDEGSERALSLAKRYGAAILVLAGNRDAALTPAYERLRMARRLVERAESHGIPLRDVIVDAFGGSAPIDPASRKEAVSALRMIRDELGCATALRMGNSSADSNPFDQEFVATALEAGLRVIFLDPTDRRAMDAMSPA